MFYAYLRTHLQLLASSVAGSFGTAIANLIVRTYTDVLIIQPSGRPSLVETVNKDPPASLASASS